MTLRSFAIGIILLVSLTIGMTYNDYVAKNTPLTGAINLPVVVAFLVIIFSAVVNPLLRCFRPKWVFSQAEIVVIWCLLAAGLTIPSFGVLRYMLPMMVSPFYYAASGSEWDKAFYEHIPDWLVPSKDPQSPIVTMFFEGTYGEAVPWGAWVVPFFGWGIMLMGVFLVMFCMTAIIRKQWVQYERLSFPIARIPLEISTPPESGRFFNALLRCPLTWVGAAVPIGFWGLHVLNQFYPWVPVIPNSSWAYWGVFNGIFGSGWQGHFNIYFLTIGVMFLLPTDISLSLWLFFVLGAVQRSIRQELGYVGGGFGLQQQAGAYFAFAALALWTMRGHLKDVFRKAFFRAKDVDDSDEGLPYTFAVFGWIVGVVIVVGWFSFIGCSPLVALVIVMISCVAFLVLARVVAQCGMIHTAFRPGPLMIARDFVGAANIGPKGLTAATFYQASLFADQREVLMPSLLNNSRMAEKKLSLRKLFMAMMVAVVISYTVGYFSQIGGYYKNGLGEENSYHACNYPRGQLDQLATAAGSDEGLLRIGPGGAAQVLAGGAAFALVHFLRSRLYWWPVHPIGLLTIRTWPLQALWLSIFLGWLCKALSQKYAPGPAMTKVRYFFLGMIMGDVTITMTASIVGLIVQRQLLWNMS